MKVELISPVDEEKRRSGIKVFRQENAQKIVMKLEKKGIIVSARGEGIRVSPHFYNNEEDIDRLTGKLKNLI